MRLPRFRFRPKNFAPLYFCAIGLFFFLMPETASAQNPVVRTVPAPAITPPFPGLERKFDSFDVNTDKCTRLVMGSGSAVVIPENAFVSATGQAVRGTVKVRFREWHHAIDLLLSGIPMYISQASKKKYFDSAGMFEIRAEQNGMPVEVAPGKKVQVFLRSNMQPDGTRFWSFNDASGSWEDKGDPEQVIVPYQTEPQETLATAPAGDLVGEGDFDGNWDGEWDPKADSAWRAQQNQDLADGNVSEGIVYYVAGLSKMGVYNYDAFLKEEDAVTLLPQFVYNQPKASPDANVYVVYPGKQAVQYFSSYDWANNFHLLKFQPDVRIFSIQPDKRIAIYPNPQAVMAELPSLAAGSSKTFDMEIQPSTVNSGDQLKKLLNVQ